MATTPIDPNFAHRLLLVRGSAGFADLSNNALTPNLNGSVTVATPPGALWQKPATLRFLREASGISSYVAYSKPGGLLAAATTTFTMEFFLSLDDLPYTGGSGGKTVVRCTQAGAVTYSLYVYGVSSGAVMMAMENPGNRAFDAGPFPVGTRVHIALVGDGTFLTFYVDGVLKYHGLDLGPFNADRVQLGNPYISAATVQAQGFMEEFRLSDIAEYAGNSFTPPALPFFGTDMFWPAQCKAWPGGMLA